MKGNNYFVKFIRITLNPPLMLNSIDKASFKKSVHHKSLLSSKFIAREIVVIYANFYVLVGDYC